MPMDPLTCNDAGETVRYIEFTAIKFVLPMVTNAALYRYFTIIQNQNLDIHVNKWRLAEYYPLNPNDPEYETKVVSRDFENWEFVAFVPVKDAKNLMRNGEVIKFMFWRAKINFWPRYDPPGFWFVDRRVGNA